MLSIIVWRKSKSNKTNYALIGQIVYNSKIIAKKMRNHRLE